MTVSTTASRITYNGDASSLAFAFPYYFLANTDLDVYVGGVLKTLNVDYTVTGAGAPSGGAVTFTTAPALGAANIVILRDPDQLQSTAYPANDKFPSAAHERALDKLTMLVQRIRDLLGRSLTLPDSLGTSVSTTLPTPEANKVIGWNSAASALQNFDANLFASVIAYGTANADIFTGDGVTTQFTLSANPGALNNLDVSVGGVSQVPGVDYVWTAGTMLTFTTAPPAVPILVRYMQGLPQGTLDAASVNFSAEGSLEAIGTRSTRTLATLRALPKPNTSILQALHVRVAEHTAGTGVGGGLFSWSATSTATDDNALVVNPTGNAGNGRWLRMYEGDALVTYWGAVGDGVTDDTAAVQAAVTWAVGTVDGVGKGLMFPASQRQNTIANYKLSASIKILRSQGWRLYGSGIYGATLTQSADQTPIFEFQREITHSWEISNFAATWTNVQTGFNRSRFIEINCNAFTGGGVFKGKVDRITFGNGYQLIGLRTVNVNQILWSITVDNILITSCTGNAMDFIPSPSFGQPGISIRNVYLINASQATLPHMIRVTASDSLTIENFEVNQGTNIGLLDIQGSIASIGAVKAEILNITSAGSGIGLIQIGNSRVRVGAVSFAFASFDVGANNTVYGVNFQGSNCLFDAGVIQLSGASTYVSGGFAFNASSSRSNRWMTSKILSQGTVPNGLARTSSTAGSDFAIVREWTDPSISFNNATTTPIQLVVGDAPVQYYATAITADQIIRLPDVAGNTVGTAIYTNAVQGLRYRIVRTSTATGAFNINVQTSTGAALHTLSAAATAVEFMWVRAVGWVKVEAGAIA